MEPQPPVVPSSPIEHEPEHEREPLPTVATVIPKQNVYNNKLRRRLFNFYYRFVHEGYTRVKNVFTDLLVEFPTTLLLQWLHFFVVLLTLSLLLSSLCFLGFSMQ